MEFLAVTCWGLLLFTSDCRESSLRGEFVRSLVDGITRTAGLGNPFLNEQITGVFQFMYIVMRITYLV